MKKIIIFIMLTIMITFSCSKESISMFEKHKISVFWDWFKTNEEFIRNSNSENREKYLDKILERLSKIEKNLSVEISGNKNNDNFEVFISAEGDKNKFSIVTRIVDQAPKIDKWKITAFRQRTNTRFVLKIDDIILDTNKMFFEPVIEGTELNIIVYGDNFNSYDRNKLVHYGLIYMDNLIGEYDCVMSVKYYDFIDISSINDRSKLFPIFELPEYIDNRKKT